jgi:AcrR family transcriptional regulator
MASTQPTTVTDPVTTRTRARLSREEVARAALEIIDRDGLDGLSMRRIADALGVGTMTLYGYFRSKEELLDAVIDAAVGKPRPSRGEGPWRDQLADLIRTSRRTLVRHPALVQIRFRQPVLRPESLRFAEAGLRILLSAGFDAREATQAFRLLFTYMFGFAGLSPAETTAEQRRQAAAAIAALPPEDYPALTGAAAEASWAMAGEEQFEYGLERILDGLEARLSARAGAAAAGGGATSPPPRRRRRRSP